MIDSLNLLFTNPVYNKKSTSHAKKPKKCDPHPRKRNHSIERDPKVTLMFKLADKNFIVVISCMFKDLKKKISIINKQMGNLSRATKTILF